MLYEIRRPQAHTVLKIIEVSDWDPHETGLFRRCVAQHAARGRIVRIEWVRTERADRVGSVPLRRTELPLGFIRYATTLELENDGNHGNYGVLGTGGYMSKL